ncbi:chondroitin AC/alginate lyase [Atractiella rhizophila]|nr:chondroitin AC/alginate lyase [Atractiella rhizophila]
MSTEPQTAQAVQIMSFFLSLFALFPLFVKSLNIPNYPNIWIDPVYVLSRNWPNSTRYAQQNIVAYADEVAQKGPWSVIWKNAGSPSGDKHDYVSLAPYWWPDCSKAKNTTVLSQAEIEAKCVYRQRDGKFNPDTREEIDGPSDFGLFTNAVLYNTLAWIIEDKNLPGSGDKYATRAVEWLKIWFLEEETRMNPHLNYAQLIRGLGRNVGAHIGVLDFKSMPKLVSAVLILRQGRSAALTSDIDRGLIAWFDDFVVWLKTSDVAKDERRSMNNHGTFYYNNIVSSQILTGNYSGARQTLDRFFSLQFPGMIDVNGEQPREAIRTRPFHYRAFNLQAMVHNIKLAAFLAPSDSPSPWLRTTDGGANIQTAVDFAMMVDAGNERIQELSPSVATVAVAYGDPDRKYAQWLKVNDPIYPVKPAFFWEQPFTDGGFDFEQWARDEEDLQRNAMSKKEKLLQILPDHLRLVVGSTSFLLTAFLFWVVLLLACHRRLRSLAITSAATKINQIRLNTPFPSPSAFKGSFPT